MALDLHDAERTSVFVASTMSHCGTVKSVRVPVL